MSSKSEDKKNLILRTAMQLFSSKGVSSTSMQEIAQACGVSKGSLYLHFKSKEELENSIHSYCFDLLKSQLGLVEQEHGLDPKQKFCRYLEVIMELVLELKDLIMTQSRDLMANGRSPSGEMLMHHAQLKQLVLYFRDHFTKMYGKEVIPHALDLLVIVYGLLVTYINLFLNAEFKIGTRQMAEFITTVIDISAMGAIQKQTDPLIKNEMVEDWFNQSDSSALSSKRHPLLILKDIKIILKNRPLDDVVQQGIESVEIMELELQQLKPRRAIITGMVANIDQVPETHDFVQELKLLLQSYL